MASPSCGPVRRRRPPRVRALFRPQRQAGQRRREVGQSTRFWYTESGSTDVYLDAAGKPVKPNMSTLPLLGVHQLQPRATRLGRLAAQGAGDLSRAARLVGPRNRRRHDPRAALPIFRDRDELPSSADLGGASNEALRQSRYQIVICSPRAAASRWVNEEIRTFKRSGPRESLCWRSSSTASPTPPTPTSSASLRRCGSSRRWGRTHRRAHQDDRCRCP